MKTVKIETATTWRHDEKTIKCNFNGKLTYFSNDPTSKRYQPVTYKIFDEILKQNGR